MSNLKIYKGSENYVATVIKLPAKVPVKGLDNLVAVNYAGNTVLISKDSDENELYLFFPAETQLSDIFLSSNSLYRHEDLNLNPEKKGFFENSGRVKSLKLKGEISTGFIIPIWSLALMVTNNDGFLLDQEDLKDLKVGDEFNEFLGIKICQKYINEQKEKVDKTQLEKKREKVSSKYVPEHMDTSHLMKNVHKLNLEDTIAVTYKLHGTSARWFNAPVKRKSSLIERIALFFGAKIQETEHRFVAASRRVIKSVGNEIKEGNHYHAEDLYTRVGKQFFEGKLNEGEAVYGEVVGRETLGGKEIQKNYSYGFNEPKVFIYRISNINTQGIEIDLPYPQMKERALQLGVEVCPELFYGNMKLFLQAYVDKWVVSAANGIELEETLNNVFYNKLLEQPSILDKNVVEEGFCIRVDKYPKPLILKVKSKKFLLSETKLKDEGVADVEEQESIINEA